MWREETGFLEMFLAYYTQCKGHLTTNQAYRDFLFDILSAHEENLSNSCNTPATENNSYDNDAPSETWDSSGFPSTTSAEDDIKRLVANGRSQVVEETAAVFPSAALNFTIKQEVVEMEEIAQPLDSLTNSFMLQNQESFPLASPQAFPEDVPVNPDLSSFKTTQPRTLVVPQTSEQSIRFAEGPSTSGPCVRTVERVAKWTGTKFGRSAQKSYACNVCGKCFNDASNYRRHQRIHSGLKPYMCKVCSKSFSDISNLRSHQRCHSGEHPYVCRICGKGFAFNSQLQHHERLHPEEKPFPCTECGKVFRHQTHLRQHEKIHAKVKTFVCKTCAKSFTRICDLQRHELLHSAEKRYI